MDSKWLWGVTLGLLIFFLDFLCLTLLVSLAGQIYMKEGFSLGFTFVFLFFSAVSSFALFMTYIFFIEFLCTQRMRELIVKIIIYFYNKKNPCRKCIVLPCCRNACEPGNTFAAKKHILSIKIFGHLNP